MNNIKNHKTRMTKRLTDTFSAVLSLHRSDRGGRQLRGGLSQGENCDRGAVRALYLDSHQGASVRVHPEPNHLAQSPFGLPALDRGAPTRRAHENQTERERERWEERKRGRSHRDTRKRRSETAQELPTPHLPLFSSFS